MKRITIGLVLLCVLLGGCLGKMFVKTNIDYEYPGDAKQTAEDSS